MQANVDPVLWKPEMGLCYAAVASSCGVNGTDCSLQVYMGASGNDRNGIAFNSGWMIQEINRFSVFSLYDNAKQNVSLHVVNCALLHVVCSLHLANGTGTALAGATVSERAMKETHAGCLYCSQ